MWAVNDKKFFWAAFRILKCWIKNGLSCGIGVAWFGAFSMGWLPEALVGCPVILLVDWLLWHLLFGEASGLASIVFCGVA